MYNSLTIIHFKLSINKSIIFKYLSIIMIIKIQSNKFSSIVDIISGINLVFYLFTTPVRKL